MPPRTSLQRVSLRGRAAWRWLNRRTWTPRLLRVAQFVVTGGIVVYLVYRLSGLGWERVWEALPRTPWFYVIFAAIYLTLPLAEMVVFRLLWKLPFRTLLSAMLKRRVYNKDVLGYSGDVYLYLWARGRVALPDTTVLHHLKDNAILSGLASTVLALGLLAFFVLSGLVALPRALAEADVGLVIGAGLVGALVVIAALRLRRSVLKVPGRLALTIFGFHLLRILTVQGLQVVEWAVVLPEVAVTTWLTFLAVQIVLNTIPLLPSSDLLFVGAGIELAAFVDVPVAAAAGLFLVHSVLDKCLNVVLFVAVAAFDRSERRLARVEVPPVPEPTVPPVRSEG